MTRIIIKKLEDNKKGSVAEKRLRNAEGKLVRVLSIDANSKTFDSDLTELFRKNVAKARRENKRLLGSASGMPTRR